MATASVVTTAVLAVVLSAAMSTLPVAVADAGFIARTCKDADNDKCVGVLGTDPRSVNATTVRDLAGIALDLAVSNARDSDGIINGRAGAYEGTPEGEALRLCNQLYYNAADDLDGDARGSFGSGDYAATARLLSDAADTGDACEKAFADLGVRSVVADVDERMKERCGVAGDLVDLLYVAAAS